MAKKLALVMMWFFTAPLLIASTIFLIRHNEIQANQAPQLAQKIEIPQGVNIQTTQIEGQVLAVEISDMRPYLVENFLKGTPLETHSKLIVQTSDKYGIDWKLIPAIAMKESQAGKAVRGYNAWGFENGKTQFDSWESAIETVAKTLKTRYIAKGLTTPEEIMAIYAPPQLLTGGKWAKDVNYFFTQLENL